MSRINARNIIDSFKTVLIFIAILWIILAISKVVPINGLGIRPRTMIGLVGIVLAPFLHTGINHLLTNSISLLILGTIFLVVERKLSLLILLQIMILAGLGTWLIGRAGYVHIGASGVIYGLLGYLLAIGIFTRSILTIAVSLLVFFLYGGAIWGIFPTGGFISWEGHLCGFLSGILIAKVYSRRGH